MLSPQPQGRPARRPSTARPPFRSWNCCCTAGSPRSTTLQPRQRSGLVRETHTLRLHSPALACPCRGASSAVTPCNTGRLHPHGNGGCASSSFFSSLSPGVKRGSKKKRSFLERAKPARESRMHHTRAPPVLYDRAHRSETLTAIGERGPPTAQAEKVAE